MERNRQGFEQELFDALVDYWRRIDEAIEAAGLSPTSGWTYKLHTIQFVRCVIDDFHPGERRNIHGGNDLERLRAIIREMDVNGPQD